MSYYNNISGTTNSGHTIIGGTSSNVNGYYSAIRGGYSAIRGGTHEWLPCELCGKSIKTLAVPMDYNHICSEPTKELYNEMIIEYKSLIEPNKREDNPHSILTQYPPYKNPNTGDGYKMVDAEWASKLTYDEWVKWCKGEIKDSVMQGKYIKLLEYRVKTGKEAQEELNKLK